MLSYTPYSLTDHKRPDLQYCDQVLDGTIPSGEKMIQAVERHLEDLGKGELHGLYYLPDEASKFLKFSSKHLRLSPTERFRLPSWMVFLSCMMDAWWYEDCLLYTSPSPRD